MKPHPPKALTEEILRLEWSRDWPSLLRLAVIFGSERDRIMQSSIEVVQEISFPEIGQQYWLLEQLRTFQESCDKGHQIEAPDKGIWNDTEKSSLLVLMLFPLIQYCEDRTKMLREEVRTEYLVTAIDATEQGIRQAEFIGDYSLIGFLHGMKANGHSQQRDMNRAEMSFSLALSNFRQAAADSPELYVPFVAKTWANIAATRAQFNDMKSAQEAFDNAKHSYETLVDEDNSYSEEFAALLCNIGAFSEMRSRPDDAKSHYLQALQFASSGEFSTETMVAINSNLGVTLTSLGELKGALYFYEEALALIKAEESLVLDSNRGKILNNIGVMHLAIGASTPAIDTLEEAISVRERLSQDRPEVHITSVAESLANLTIAQRLDNNTQGAIESGQRALSILTHAAQQGWFVDPQQIALTTTALGMAFIEANLIPDAIRALEIAVQYAEGLANTTDNSFLSLLALSHRRLAAGISRLRTSAADEEAEKHFARAIKIYASPGAAHLQREHAHCLRAYAEHHDERGHQERAIELLRASAKIHRKVDSEHDFGAGDLGYSTYATLAGRLFWRWKAGGTMEELHEAAAWIADAERCIDRCREQYEHPKDEFDGRCQQFLVNHIGYLVHIALFEATKETEHLSEAFHFSETNRAQVLSQLIVNSESIRTTAPDQLRKEFLGLRRKYVETRRIFDQSSLLHQGSHAVSLSNVNPHTPSTYNSPTAELLEKQLELAGAAYKACLAKIVAIDSDFDPVQPFDEVSTEVLTDILPEDAVALQLTIAEDIMHCIVISEQRSGFATLKIDTAPPVVKEFSHSDEGMTQFQIALQEWYATEGARVADFLNGCIPPDAKTVVLSSTKELQTISIATLATSQGLTLSSRYQIHCIPNFSILRFLLRRSSAIGKRVLTVDTDNYDLEFAEPEIQSLVRTFGDCLDTINSRENLQSAIAQAGIFHFVGHAHYCIESPLESALVRSQTVTFASLREVYANLDASATLLTTLSACETGMLLPNPLDEYYNFPSAFIYAGSSCVISSLWRVDDLASFLFFDRFYTNLADGLTIETSLTMAQAWLRGDYDCRGERLGTREEVHSYLVARCCDPTRPDLEIESTLLDVAGWRLDELPVTRPFGSPFYWAAFGTFGASWLNISDVISN